MGHERTPQPADRAHRWERPDRVDCVESVTRALVSKIEAGMTEYSRCSQRENHHFTCHSFLEQCHPRGKFVVWSGENVNH